VVCFVIFLRGSAKEKVYKVVEELGGGILRLLIGGVGGDIQGITFQGDLR